MNDYANPVEQQTSHPEAFVDSIESQRLAGIARAIVNIEHAMGLDKVKAAGHITGLGRVSAGEIVPNYTEADGDLERLKPVSSKRDQAPTAGSDDDQQAMIDESRQAVMRIHEGIVSGNEPPVMTSKDAKIITLPLHSEPMERPQTIVTTSAGETAEVIPFAPIPEIPGAENATEQAA